MILYLLEKAVPSKNELQTHYKDIAQMSIQLQREWREACSQEIEILKQRNIYELVPLSKGAKMVKNRWVFAIKSDGRKKARLVAKVFSQAEGIDYNEVFSPVIRYETVRTLLAVAALENWKIFALDIKSAFLYGELDETIYMEQPQGFVVKGQEDKVLLLNRALYGLKQAARAWWQ